LSFKCGYTALIGRPNAGKSTLLNTILGSKLAITSSKPQTTRNRIAGVHTDESMQVVLIDTPGIHQARTELNKQMVAAAQSAIADVDVVVWLGDMTMLARRVEAGEPAFDEVDEVVVSALQGAKVPVVFAANKMDVVPAPLVLPVIDAVRQRLQVAAAVPVSALTGDGVAALLSEIRDILPEHPPLFPADQWTEVSERFLVAEIVREKIFHLTEQEVPYSTAVEVIKFDETERESENPIVRIFADVIVERPSQKGILIGKGGEMLKRIGTLARREIQDMLGCRVYLELHVKVERNWTKTRTGLRRVGYEQPE
jgi:GTP-binding protein Era